jgi:MFS family permease
MSTALSPPTDPGTFRALRHRNYRLYFAGQIVSLTGSWVQTAALTWLAYTLTAGSSLPARVTAAQVVPTLILGVWGGSLADRLPRRSLIFLSQVALLVLALALAAMVKFELVSAGALLAASVLIGVVNAVDTPARLAFVVDLVGRDDLMNAVALNSLVFNVARVVGPALGVLALPWVGLAGCFFLNGLTFVAVLVALAAMRLPPKVPTPVRDVLLPVGGFRHLAGHPGLLLLLALAGSMAFFGWPVLALLPALSDQSLGAGSGGYSWMLSAIGFGALVGALIVATFGTTARRATLIAVGVAVGPASLLGLAWSSTLEQASACCAVAGCGLILFFATAQATMQLGAGEHNRGRVMGIWLMVLAGAQPAGNLVAGQLADACGVPFALAALAGGIAGTGGLVGIAALGLRRRRGRNEVPVRRCEDPTPQPPPLKGRGSQRHGVSVTPLDMPPVPPPL